MIPEQAFRLGYDQEGKRGEIAAAINRRIEENQRDSRAITYHYPRNADEWWGNVETWWPELLALINSYGVKLSSPRDPMATFEPAASELERMRQAKDTALAMVLEKTWAGAPDHGSIHGNKGWDVLCDLCSESYVLFDEPEPEGAHDNHS